MPPRAQAGDDVGVHQSRQHRQGDLPAACLGAVRVDHFRGEFQRGRDIEQQPHQPDAEHDAADTGRPADADETVAQPAGTGDPATDFEQITEAEQLHDRDDGEDRQSQDQGKSSEKPFTDGADEPPGSGNDADEEMSLRSGQNVRNVFRNARQHVKDHRPSGKHVQDGAGRQNIEDGILGPGSAGEGRIAHASSTRIGACGFREILAA